MKFIFQLFATIIISLALVGAAPVLSSQRRVVSISPRQFDGIPFIGGGNGSNGDDTSGNSSGNSGGGMFGSIPFVGGMMGGGGTTSSIPFIGGMMGGGGTSGNSASSGGSGMFDSLPFIGGMMGGRALYNTPAEPPLQASTSPQ